MPRFLLNDFCRYWRTMAVDFAYKAKNRSGKGVAIRNIKLRMSRKLLFVSGLLSCFACELGITPKGGNSTCALHEEDDIRRLPCVDCLREVLAGPPLEMLAKVLLHLGQPALKSARQLFQSYDRFLGILDDEEKRKHLEDLAVESIETDALFCEARQVSHQFRDGVVDLFFNADQRLSELSRIYGVF